MALNTWARWERGELGVHAERARQLRRLHRLVERYGQAPLWGLGPAGLRDVLDGATVAEALAARGLDAHGAPPRASVLEGIRHGLGAPRRDLCARLVRTASRGPHHRQPGRGLARSSRRG